MLQFQLRIQSCLACMFTLKNMMMYKYWLVSNKNKKTKMNYIRYSGSVRRRRRRSNYRRTIGSIASHPIGLLRQNSRSLLLLLNTNNGVGCFRLRSCSWLSVIADPHVVLIRATLAWQLHPVYTLRITNHKQIMCSESRSRGNQKMKVWVTNRPTRPTTNLLSPL